MSELIFGYFSFYFPNQMCVALKQAVSSASIQNQLSLLKKISPYTILHSLAVKKKKTFFFGQIL
jgi:hypothetical protein